MLFFLATLHKYKSGRRSFFMISSLFEVVANKELHNVQIVNSIGPRGLFAGWYLKRKFQIPLVCTIEIINEKGTFFSSLFYFFTKLLVTKIPIDRIICWSNYYWENYLKPWGIAREKVEIIPAGINTNVFNPLIDGSEIKRKYFDDGPLIVFAKPLYFANTESAKVLVKALSLLDSKSKVKLLIGGGPGEAAVKSLVEEKKLSKQVKFMPPTPFTEIPKYIAAADLIVLPFLYAPTTSRSLLEAMAMKKPIITVKTGEIGRILKQKINAILVKPEAISISRAIKEILINKEMSERIAKNAYLLVKKEYDLSTQIEKNIKVFNNLCQ